MVHLTNEVSRCTLGHDVIDTDVELHPVIWIDGALVNDEVFLELHQLGFHAVARSELVDDIACISTHAVHAHAVAINRVRCQRVFIGQLTHRDTGLEFELGHEAVVDVTDAFQ
ncbi:hypothetical protein D3C87_1312850 [compost metagenome]